MALCDHYHVRRRIHEDKTSDLQLRESVGPSISYELATRRDSPLSKRSGYRGLFSSVLTTTNTNTTRDLRFGRVGVGRGGRDKRERSVSGAFDIAPSRVPFAAIEKGLYATIMPV